MSAKSSKTSRPKRYKSQRIINPGDVRLVRLYPNQGLNLLLDPPSSWSKGHNKQWDVQLSSEFLKVRNSYECNEDRQGRRVYELEQTGDLSDWAKMGRTFLGNLVISFKSTGEGDEDPKSMLEPFGTAVMCLEPSPDAENNVFTVVRPHNQLIRLGTHEMLEVILPDVPQLCWYPHTFPCTADGKYFLELVHTEYLPKDSQSSDHGSFVCRQRLTDDYPLAVGQHHFWFRWSERSRKEALSDAKGTYPGNRIVFIGKNTQSETVREEQLRVSLFSSKEDRKEAKKAEKEKIEKTESDLCPIQTDVTKRYVNLTKRFISNPKELEHIELHGDNDMFDVEIVRPRAGEWKAEIVPVIYKADEKKSVTLPRLALEPRESISLNGHTLQKFRVAPINIGIETADATPLGHLRLYCENLKVPDKKIVFQYTKKVLLATEMPHNASRSLITTPSKGGSSRHSSSNYHYDSSKNYYDKDKKKKVTLEYSEVEILDVTTTGLSVGETVWNPFVVSNNNRHQYGCARQYDCDAEDEVYLGIHGHQQASQDSKKKLDTNGSESSSRKQSKSASNSNSDLNGNSRNSEPNLSKGSSNGAGAESEAKNENTSTDGRRAGLSADCVENPASHTELIFTNGQTLTVVFPCNLGTAKAVVWDDKVLRTSDSGHVRISSSWVQGNTMRFKITATGHNLPPGRHLIGNILFSAVSASVPRDITDHRVILVMLDVPAPSKSVYNVSEYFDAHRMSHNTIDGRITLVDPLGDPVKICVKQHDQLEILLASPKAGGNWRIQTKMLLGNAHVIDNSEWRVVNNSRHQRILFRLDGDPISGDIGIFLGDRRHGCVELGTSVLKSIIVPREEDSRVHYTGEDEADTYLDLREGQSIILDPKRPACVRIAKPDKYLSTYLAHRSRNLAKVHFWQNHLSERVLGHMERSIAEIVDQYRPWEGFECFPTPGSTPWDSLSCCFPALKEKQPYYEEIVEAYSASLSSRLPVLPIGNLECDFNISDLFRVSNSYTVAIKNTLALENVIKEQKPMELIDPVDTSGISVHDGMLVKVVLNAKLASGNSVEVRVPWRLVSSPTWLFPASVKREANNRQIFFFYCYLPNETNLIKGKLVFDCANLVKRIGVSAWTG